METVRRPEELASVLGDEFVLFVGSAVSAWHVGSSDSPEFLPLVGTAMSAYFDEVYRRLRGGDYVERSYAAYARELAAGRYRGYLERTKFEEFLGRLERCFGRHGIGQLLGAFFSCGPEQFTFNHAAVASLLAENHTGKTAPSALACLTTNYDDAIERATPGTQVFVHSARSQPMSPHRSLIKLHGDVRTGSYVATMGDLRAGVLEQSHEYLLALLKGRVVWVLGYSGVGDVDIAPLLGDAGAVLVWTVRDKQSRAPEYAHFRVVSDLRSGDPRKNWLLWMADASGWTPARVNGRPPWRDRLARWGELANRDGLRRSVEEVLEPGPGWPVLHLRHVKELRQESQNDATARLQLARACLGIGAYRSAERMLSTLGASTISASQLAWYQAFTSWRIGRLEAGLDRLAPSAMDASVGSPPERDEFLRLYLEILRDQLLYERRIDVRLQILAKRRGQAILDELRARRQDNFAGQLLADIVGHEVRYLVGGAVSRELCRELGLLVNQAIALQLWGVAEAAARALVRQNRRLGLVALLRIDRILIGLGWWNTIRKSAAAALAALIPGVGNLLLYGLDGPALAPAVTWWRERNYRGALAAWRRAQEAGRVIVE